MLAIAYFLVFFPLRVAFGLSLYNSGVAFIALAVILMDIIISLNTGFYDKGSLVSDRVGILMNYLTNRALTDAISLMPFIIYDFSGIDENLFSNPLKFAESVISLLFLVRIFQLSQLKKKIEERFYQKKSLTHTFALLSLLLTILYIAHLLACIWIIVADYKKDTLNTWMNVIKVDEEDWYI